MRFHWNANTILSWASDSCDVSGVPVSIHPSGSLCMKCHDKIISQSLNHTFTPRWPVCTQPHPSPPQHRLGTRTTDRHSQGPRRSASREHYTTQAAHYLSSSAASYLLDAPSPARQRIWVPWGRFPSYVPCAAVQQAIDLMICFKTKLLLENGNKLILQLECNIRWTPQRFSKFTRTKNTRKICKGQNFQATVRLLKQTLKFGCTYGSHVYLQNHY